MIFLLWLGGALALFLYGVAALLWGILRMLFYAAAMLALWFLQVIVLLIQAVVAIRRERHTA